MVHCSLSSHLLLHHMTQLSSDTTPVLVHGEQMLKVREREREKEERRKEDNMWIEIVFLQ